ncbi:MAG: hypothetical protein AAF654_05680 [Myxococcota bacterium]
MNELGTTVEAVLAALESGSELGPVLAQPLPPGRDGWIAAKQLIELAFFLDQRGHKSHSAEILAALKRKLPTLKLGAQELRTLFPTQAGDEWVRKAVAGLAAPAAGVKLRKK